MRNQPGSLGLMLRLPLLLALMIFPSADTHTYAQSDESSIEPINQEPGQGECDLRIVDAFPLEVIPDNEITLFLWIVIANEGKAGSPSVPLTIHDEDRQVSATVTINPIRPGESYGEEMDVKIPASWQGTRHTLIVEIDPYQEAPESNRENNIFIIEGISIERYAPDTHEEDRATPESNNTLTPLLIVGVIGLAGFLILSGWLLIHSSMRAGRHKRWERQAKQGRPPDDCQPSHHYCEVENQVELKAMHITHLEFIATEAGSGRERRRQTIKVRLPSALRSLILARRQGESTDRLIPRIEALAQDLSQMLLLFIRDDRTSYNLAVNAHLEGIELTSNFTLYQCVGTPPKTSWKKLAGWKTRKRQERDDPVIALSGVNGADTAPAVRLPTELFSQIRDYIERY
ncbi:MAG: hypothetical protein JXB07_16735 [Anaerolineae bacterium]|nr:hypothetical protein [Anaerolineae bacterium]